MLASHRVVRSACRTVVETLERRRLLNSDVTAPGADFLDFGDAPQLPSGVLFYPTSFAAGHPDPARHVLVSGAPVLGAVADPEPDGQPNPPATGDDLSILFGGVDDEDGVTVLGAPLDLVPLTPGPVSLDVANGGLAPGFVNAWIDFDSSGTWDPAEQIAFDAPVPPGASVPIPAAIPPVAPGTLLYARFRISSAPGLAPAGLAPDGEVEDYAILVEGGTEPRLDFGDAPDFTGAAFKYPTVFGSASGLPPARHVISVPGPVLGPSVDPEPDGQPNLPASGDDLSILFGGIDDENGVTVAGAPLETVAFIGGSTVSIDVANTGLAGKLNAWFDWDLSGTWDASEQVAIDTPLPGLAFTSILVPVPITVPSGSIVYARFRADVAGGLTPAGLAPNGEVEDYAVVVAQPPRDFGDAPDTAAGPFMYPTIAGGSGIPASHGIVAGAPMLGLTIDAEPDGAFFL